MIEIIFLIFFIIIYIFFIEYFNLFNKKIYQTENFKSNTNKKLFDSDKKNNKIIYKDDKILFNNLDYNQNLSIDNKNNKYFYNDMINQSNINETSFNIINSIDPIDYSDVKTGIEKCFEQCDGICFENGYDGVATCYPKYDFKQTFDWGTLYKNPTFTYGYNAYNYDDLKQ